MGDRQVSVACLDGVICHEPGGAQGGNHFDGVRVMVAVSAEWIQQYVIEMERACNASCSGGVPRFQYASGRGSRCLNAAQKAAGHPLSQRERETI